MDSTRVPAPGTTAPGELAEWVDSAGEPRAGASVQAFNRQGLHFVGHGDQSPLARLFSRSNETRAAPMDRDGRASCMRRASVNDSIVPGPAYLHVEAAAGAAQLQRFCGRLTFG